MCLCMMTEGEVTNDQESDNQCFVSPDAAPEFAIGAAERK